MGDLQPLKQKGQAGPILGYTNQPAPVRVLTGPDGKPRMLQAKHSTRMLRVERLQDEWRVDDRWWRDHPTDPAAPRESVHRRYYELQLPGGIIEHVFLDENTGAWFRQRYEERSPELERREG